MNKLFYSNSLDELRRFVRDETVDRYYIAPPFNSATFLKSMKFLQVVIRVHRCAVLAMLVAGYLTTPQFANAQTVQSKSNPTGQVREDKQPPRPRLTSIKDRYDLGERLIAEAQAASASGKFVGFVVDTNAVQEAGVPGSAFVKNIKDALARDGIQSIGISSDGNSAGNSVFVFCVGGEQVNSGTLDELDKEVVANIVSLQKNLAIVAGRIVSGTLQDAAEFARQNPGTFVICFMLGTDRASDFAAKEGIYRAADIDTKFGIKNYIIYAHKRDKPGSSTWFLVGNDSFGPAFDQPEVNGKITEAGLKYLELNPRAPAKNKPKSR